MATATTAVRRLFKTRQRPSTGERIIKTPTRDDQRRECFHDEFSRRQHVIAHDMQRSTRRTARVLSDARVQIVQADERLNAVEADRASRSFRRRKVKAGL